MCRNPLSATRALLNVRSWAFSTGVSLGSIATYAAKKPRVCAGRGRLRRRVPPPHEHLCGKNEERTFISVLLSERRVDCRLI